MSRGFQKVIIMGTLGKDPEVRSTQGGKTVANFSVAVNGYKDQTEWFSVQAWEKTAEVCKEYLKKGNQVLVEGAMQTRSWDGDNGKQYRTELIASNVTLLGNGDSRDSRGATKAKKEWDADTYIKDEDVPF